MRSTSNQNYPFNEKGNNQSGSRISRPARAAVRNHASSRRRTRRIWPALSLVLLFLALFLALGVTGGWHGLFGLLPASTDATSSAESTSASTAGTTVGTAVPTVPAATPTPTLPPDVEVTLTGVGDIILHQAVIDGGLTGAGTESYDYRPIFQYVKPILAASDLAMANYEGTLAGAPYSGYPFFCAPDAIADALADAGVSAVWTANNHTIDKGLAGVIRTASVFRAKGFQVVGTRADETQAADTVVDAGGIKIGLMAYTFETTGTETQKTLNGIPMPAEADPLIDSFNPYRDAAMKQDMAAMLARADVLRGQGAEIICLSLHWGNEYKTRSCDYQQKMAQQLADAGIELIIGHHPHVLEEIDVLTSAKTGRPTLVYYSIGNFLANMDYDTHGTAGKAQDAVIARITLRRVDGAVQVAKGEYIPTHVVRVPKGKQLQHLIVPVLPGLDDPDSYQTTRAEMESALDRITAILHDSQGSSSLPVSQTAQ